MSQPRRIRPGTIWFVTRRTTRRFMLLRPDVDGVAQKIYWYVTAVLAEKFGIELHAVQVLSTHMHEVLTDVRGLLPAFLRERNRILANVLKRHRDWPEEVFQRAPASCVELYGAEVVAQKIGYTLANCVEAGLVNEPAEWPGVGVNANEIGNRVVDVERPSMYFDTKNPRWPARATIAITMPALLTTAYAAKARDRVRTAVCAAVERARAIARKARYVVEGAASLFNVPFTRRARSAEPVRQRNPTFATGGDPELRRRAVDELRGFRALYRQALEALKRGLARVPFPEGSWRWCRELLPARLSRRPISMSVGPMGGRAISGPAGADAAISAPLRPVPSPRSPRKAAHPPRA